MSSNDPCDHNATASNTYYEHPNIVELHVMLQRFPTIQKMLEFFPNIHRARCYKSTIYDNYCQVCRITRRTQTIPKDIYNYHLLVCETAPPTACLNCRYACYRIEPITKCEECFFTYIQYVVNVWRRNDTIRHWDGIVPTIDHYQPTP